MQASSPVDGAFLWAFRQRRPGSREWSQLRCIAFRYAVSTLRASIPNAFALRASRGKSLAPHLRIMAAGLRNFPTPRKRYVSKFPIPSTIKLRETDGSAPKPGQSPRSGLRAARYLRRLELHMR